MMHVELSTMLNCIPLPVQGVASINYETVWVCIVAYLVCHVWFAQYSSAAVLLSLVRWLDSYGSINIQFMYANSCQLLLSSQIFS